MNDIMPFLNLGMGGAIAVFVILVWRQDRKGWANQYQEDRKASEARFAALAADFRTIVQDNTMALTKLVDRLDKVTRCPFAHLENNDLELLRVEAQARKREKA